MKARVKRTISSALSLVMASSLWIAGAPAAAAQTQEPALTGSIGVTVRFDLPQAEKNAAARDIRLMVTGGDKQTTVCLPNGRSPGNGLNAGISVQAKNVDGDELTTEEQIGYYQAELTSLPAGETYKVKLTGTGYIPFETTVRLADYSKHLIVGTGDGTFSLGDINGDGVVDSKDLDGMSGKLGGRDRDFDLNGDGRVDVTDLSYINHNRGNTGGLQILDTAAIVSVTLPQEQGLDIPITLSDPVETSEIQITCPDGNGAIQKGEALVELEDGSTQTVPFDVTPPAGVHAIGRTADQRVVTIDLGRKVAVKKVTITVTATTGNTNYATVTKVEFLKDIVPDAPKSSQPQILSAVPGDGSVSLAWTAVPNVTGYEVKYWPASTSGQEKTVSANVSKAVVSGLENLTTYQFQVTAVNGDWRGTPSAIVSATPEPGRTPGAPSNIGVTAADQALRLSWGKTKDATFYQVFYREAGQSDFTRFGGDMTGTSAVITGLTNGTTYQVAVKAGNGKGVGPYSATASGTPKKEELVLPELPEEGRIDSSMVESVVMENPNNVNRSLCPNFTTKDVIDNDAATYWVANQWWVSSKFTYTFKEPQDMNYAILVPYLGGSHKYALKTYAVTAKNEAGETVVSGSYAARSMDSNKNYLVLTFPLAKGVKELSISLSEREGNGCRVSISEMAFYQSDTLADEIAGLFTDGTFTALKSGVTAQQITALSDRLDVKADFYLELARLRDELALAQALQSGKTDALGVVKQNFQSRGGSQDEKYGQGGSALQPLGVSARAGATVAVYAELPDDADVCVVPTQYFGESGIWNSAPIKLVNGRNYITVPKIGSLEAERGGPLYLTYSGGHPEQIKVQVRGDANTFAIPVLEVSGWYDMDELARRDTIRSYVTQLSAYVAGMNSNVPGTDVRNATEISTPSVLLSIPASQALAGLKGVTRDTDQMIETMYQNVLAWEDELYVANQVQGIIPAAGARPDSYRYPMTVRQNIRYMRMFAGAFMYAAGNHVGVGYGSTSALVCGKPVSATGVGSPNGLFGWGIAHEIGHNMDKLGKAEITNNIYALAMQAWDGQSMVQNTRLTISEVWPAIYEKTASARPGTAGNVFVQLGMYWQLHLAYDKADKPLDFYNRFFTAWKSNEYSGYSYDERVALIASKTAGKDLSDFFTHWGMTLGDAAKAELAKLALPKEQRAIWYLNDASYACRLSGGKAFAGTVSLSAKTEENKAILTIAGGDDTILGYEVRWNGKAIGFTTESTYTDDLGSANNLTYTYSVVPVDKLGNLGAEAKADEVRVAYDKAIDTGLYNLTRDGTTVTITMKNGAVPVTGIKLTGTDMTGSYTVELKAKAADQVWTKVKEGTASGSETVAYFTKPGAGPDDTRIWTYDAAVLRITGVPEGAEVTPLDYPGDRVDFYTGAAVGRLKSDYRFGDKPDEVVPAGTLVVLGTYRGDPAYNTLEIQAQYDTTGEGQEGSKEAVIQRAMNGYALLFAEIPKDGKVSDTSDGFWLFVPDQKAEEELNAQAGVTGGPMELQAVLYRYDSTDHTGTPRTTSTTLWISFPALDALPEIILTGEGAQ